MEIVSLILYVLALIFGKRNNTPEPWGIDDDIMLYEGVTGIDSDAEWW